VGGGTAEIAPTQVSAALRDLPITGWQLNVRESKIVVQYVIPDQNFPPEKVVQRVAALLAAKDIAAPRIEAERIERLQRGVTGKVKTLTLSR
jgi:hypothetical protein